MCKIKVLWNFAILQTFETVFCFSCKILENALRTFSLSPLDIPVLKIACYLPPSITVVKPGLAGNIRGITGPTGAMSPMTVALPVFILATSFHHRGSAVF
jgi:hypothetical protein